MDKSIVLKGALTSKPYAFKGRSWELESVEGVNFFDSLGTKIRYDLRDGEISRILPIKNNWIDDRIRFSYDGFRRQRLEVPMVRVDTISTRYIPVSWEEVFRRIHSFKKGSSIFVKVGGQVDLQTMKILHQAIRNTSYNNKDSMYLVGHRRTFLLPTKMDDADLIFLVGVTLRYKIPLFHLKLKQRVRHENLKVVAVGCNGVDFPHYSLGCALVELERVAEGRHKVVQMICSSVKPIILIGEGGIRRRDHLSIIRMCYSIVNLQNVGSLLPVCAQINCAELGLPFWQRLVPIKVSPDGEQNSSVFWFIGEDNFHFGKNESLSKTIYQGHHGDRMASICSILLPMAAPFEHRWVAYSCYGELLDIPPILSPWKDVFEPWMVTKGVLWALDCFEEEESGKVESPFPFLEVGSSIYSNTTDWDEGDFKSVLGEGWVFGGLIQPVTDTFYQSDSITRSSPSMALARRRFLRGVKRCTKVLFYKM